MPILIWIGLWAVVLEVSKMKPLGAEFERIWNDNIDRLYES